MFRRRHYTVVQSSDPKQGQHGIRASAANVGPVSSNARRTGFNHDRYVQGAILREGFLKRHRVPIGFAALCLSPFLLSALIRPENLAYSDGTSVYSSSAYYPAAPSLRYALVKLNSTSAPADEQLRLFLGPRIYKITYLSGIPRQQIEAIVSGTPTFYANFETRETEGNLEKARAIVLIGDLTVEIGKLTGDVFLEANVLSIATKTLANFNLIDVPSQGPLGKMEEIQIYVLGRLEMIYFKGLAGRSTAEVKFLELAPTKQDLEKYESAVEIHNKKRNNIEKGVLEKESGKSGTRRMH